MTKSTGLSEKDRQAPDGGWGWCVVAASFLVHVISDGIMYTNGIVLREVREYFEASRKTMGIMASLTNVVAYGSTGLNGAMIKRWGCRRVGVIGGLVLGAGIILSAFSPNMNFLFFSFAIVAAWGIGIVFVPSLVVVADYFYKKRSFATGLAVSGAGIGTFIFAPLVKFLLDWYGWSGCYAILGALAFNCVACALIYRPVVYRQVDELHVVPQTPTDNQSSVAADKFEEDKVCPNVCHSLPNLHVTPLTPSQNSEQSTWRRNSATDLTLTLCNQKNLPDAFSRNQGKQEEELHEGTSFISVDHAIDNKCDRTEDLKYKYGILGRFITNLKGRAVILNKKAILIWSVGSFFTGCAYSTVFTFLPDLAVETGYSKNDAAFLISTVGIASTVSRAFLGWVSDKPFVNKPLALAADSMVLAVSMALIPASSVRYALIVCNAVVYGTGYGYRVAQMPVVVAELVGTDQIGAGLGLLYFTGSVGGLIGSPLAGMLFDKSGSYTLSFVVMGSIEFIGAILFCFVLCTPEYKESRKRLKAERSCKKPNF